MSYQPRLARHDERCKDCKKSVLALLQAAYGHVVTNFQTSLPSRLDGYSDQAYGHTLEKIYESLTHYRGHQDFAKAKQLPPVDFFVATTPGQIIEFDESQHFTQPRELTLGLYPQELSLGFSRERWLSLCSELNKKDNDPPYRDEQRAWYDVLRDFAPLNLAYKPTVRLYSRDFTWCSLDATKLDDVERFKRRIEDAGK
jgi:hypothetical protein